MELKIKSIALAIALAISSFYAEAKKTDKDDKKGDKTSLTLHEDHIYKLHYNVEADKLGLKGYSPVSYFEEGKAEEGLDQYHADYHDITYFFTSQEQAEKFKANPLKYLPEYGGYCTFGVKLGKKLDSNPAAFKMVDDKLYLFKSSEALAIWNKSGNDDKKLEVANGKWEVLKLLHN